MQVSGVGSKAIDVAYASAFDEGGFFVEETLVGSGRV